jgi:hypothetical protein
VKMQTAAPINLRGNTMNSIQFEKVKAAKMKITFQHDSKQVALVEIEYY